MDSLLIGYTSQLFIDTVTPLYKGDGESSTSMTRILYRTILLVAVLLFSSICVIGVSAQDDNPNSESPWFVGDILIPIATGTLGLVGGYLLGPRAQVKQLKAKYEIDDARAKEQVFLTTIRELDRMMRNPNFRTLGVAGESGQDIHDSLLVVDNIEYYLNKEERKQYDAFRGPWIELYSQNDKQKREKFMNMVQDFANLIKVKYKEKIFPMYKKVTGDNKEMPYVSLSHQKLEAFDPSEIR